MKTIYIKNHKEFENTVKEYRSQGYMIVTYWKDFAEMEKGNDLIVIDKKSK